MSFGLGGGRHEEGVGSWCPRHPAAGLPMSPCQLQAYRVKDGVIRKRVVGVQGKWETTPSH